MWWIWNLLDLQQSVAAGQLGSISRFSEAATAVGINLISLSRQRFCSHSFCLIPAHFPPHYLDKLRVFHIFTLSVPALNLNWIFISSNILTQELSAECTYLCICLHMCNCQKCSFVFITLLNLWDKMPVKMKGPHLSAVLLEPSMGFTAHRSMQSDPIFLLSWRNIA